MKQIIEANQSVKAWSQARRSKSKREAKLVEVWSKLSKVLEISILKKVCSFQMSQNVAQEKQSLFPDLSNSMIS